MTQSIVGALRVNLGLDAAQFTKGLTAAQVRLKQFGQRMQGIGETMSLAVTGPLAAVTAAAGVAARSLSELQNQSRIAGLAAQDFKVLAIAASEFGIEQEKLADILKDVNDKFGDYFSTGQGPLADFFDNIAPKVGLTAEAFRGLSSDRALQLYVSALQQANVSQAEMTFYMEALASDATALTGVFLDNGRALASVRAEAEQLGLSIDAGLIERARAVDRQFRIASEVLSVQFRQALVQLAPLAQRLMSALVPVLAKIAAAVIEIGEAFSRLSPQVQNFALAVTAIAAAAGPVLAGLGALAQALAALRLAALAAAGPWAALALLIGAAAASFLTYGKNTGEVKGPTEEARIAIALLNEVLADSNVKSPEAAGNAIKQAQAYAKQAEGALKAAEAELELMNVRVAAMSFPGVENNSNPALEKQKAEAEAQRQIIASLSADLEAARARIKATVVQITSMDDATAGAAGSVSTLKVELEGTEIAAGGASQGMDALTDALENSQDPLEQAASRIESGLEGALMGLIERTQSVGDAFKSMVKLIIAEVYRAAVVKPIIDGIMNGFGGGGGLGGFIARNFGGARAEGGPVMPGRAYLVGERGPEMIVPQSAGTVIPNHALGGGGVTVNQVINVDGGANPAAIRQEVARLMPQIAEATKGAVIDARRRGGQMKAAFG